MNFKTRPCLWVSFFAGFYYEIRAAQEYKSVDYRRDFVHSDYQV